MKTSLTTTIRSCSVHNCKAPTNAKPAQKQPAYFSNNIKSPTKYIKQHKGLCVPPPKKNKQTQKKHHFLWNRQVDWHQILVTGIHRWTVSTISQDIFLILNFSFITFFFVLVNLGPYGRKIISSEISSESMYQIHSQKIRHTPGEDLYQSCSKNYEIWKFGLLQIFFFVCANIHVGPYWSKSFKRHLLWKYAPDLLPKIHVYSWGGSLPKL